MADILRTGKVILAKNIKLDKQHNNVLDYSETDMINLILSNDHLVTQTSSASFIRVGENSIKVPFDYNTCLKANYIAFQNPHYNKYFFAFIDDVVYLNDGTTRIDYTIDNFATWFDYWNPNKCMVIREHVSDDTIGKHTIPEGLEHGEYIINVAGECETDLDSCYTIIGTTFLPDNTPWTFGAQQYGGVFSGLTYIAFRSMGSANKFLKAMDSLDKASAITTMFMIPQRFCPGTQWFTGSLGGQTDIEVGVIPNYTGAVIIRDDITLGSPSTLDGYSPKNNKLFTYPYNFLQITNNNGTHAIFNYEDFTNNTPVFSIAGVLSVGGSMKLYPNNYKKYEQTASIRSGYDFGLVGGKYPQCSWQSDPFTNWQTEQALNQSVGAIQSTISGLSSAYSGDVSGGASTILGFYTNYFLERYQHALQPNQSHGTNSADVNFGMSQAGYTYYKMSAKKEYLQSIDDYLSKFGYLVNTIKVPNQVGRRNWNYVQIGGADNIGYSSSTTHSVPATAMDDINSIYRRGVTIWHSHANLGDYSLNNDII